MFAYATDRAAPLGARSVRAHHRGASLLEGIRSFWKCCATVAFICRASDKLAPHLTRRRSHGALLARAAHRTKRQSKSFSPSSRPGPDAPLAAFESCPSALDVMFRLRLRSERSGTRLGPSHLASDHAAVGSAAPAFSARSVRGRAPGAIRGTKSSSRRAGELRRRSCERLQDLMDSDLGGGHRGGGDGEARTARSEAVRRKRSRREKPWRTTRYLAEIALPAGRGETRW